MILMFGMVNAIQVCSTYENFSSESLDLNKWEIGSNSIDEAFIENQVYHTAQLNPADKEITLKLNHTFNVGDILEYDVNYASGDGNRISQGVIDNSEYSLFGFWNSIGDGGVGNDFGVYHVKINFTEQGVSNKITLPNGTITFTRPDGNLPSVGLTHIYSVKTRTGHNGIVEMNYDNFVVCSESSSEQILELKPGKNNGELKKGLSNGTLRVFDKGIGWAKDLLN